MQKPPLNRTMKGRASSMRWHMTKEEFHLLYHFLRMFSWEVFLNKALSDNDRSIGPVPPSGGKVVPKAPKGVHFHERSEVVWFSKCQRYTVII